MVGKGHLEDSLAKLSPTSEILGFLHLQPAMGSEGISLGPFYSRPLCLYRFGP